MKIAVRLIVFLLVAAALAAGWLLYGDTLLNNYYLGQARTAEQDGRIEQAIQAYENALGRIERQPDVRVVLSSLYSLSGNDSRAERVLQDGLKLQAGNFPMNTALSALFVKQDKLADAVALLDNLETAVGSVFPRPATPTPLPPPGRQSAQVELTFAAQEGTTIYYTLNGEMPGIAGPVYDGTPIPLPPGTTYLNAVAVNADGVVGRLLRDAEYTLDRVVMPLVFEDPDVEALVRLALNRPDAPLYSNDVWGIAVIDNTDTGHIPAALDDLRWLTGLVSLTLTDSSEPYDLTPLLSLEALSSVSLSHCHVGTRELEALVQIPSLTELRLPRNLLTSLTPLAGLTQLTALDLSENNLSEILPLSGLVNLAELNLSQNKLLSDLTPLEPLTQLRVLNVSGNAIALLSPLKELTMLVELDISDNSVWDLGALAAHNDLETLKADRNNIDTIEALSGLPSLARLDITMNKVATLRPLLQCAALESVNAFGNPLTDAPGAFDNAPFTVTRS